jgi:hypothetical protein
VAVNYKKAELVSLDDLINFSDISIQAPASSKRKAARA